MAKVEFTAIVSQITGRLSGSVFQRSVGGNQLRSIGWGVNRRTLLQQSNRITMEFLASNWQLLSPGQQATWAGATGQQRFTNFVQQNFEYAWLSGNKFLIPTTPAPATMPVPEDGWFFAQTATDAFLNVGMMAPAIFAQAYQWYVELSIPTKSTTVASSVNRRYKGLIQLDSDIGQISLNMNVNTLGFNRRYTDGTKVNLRIVINTGATRGVTPWQLVNVD